MSGRRTYGYAATFVALTLGLAACGATSDVEGAESAVSQATLVAKANAICASEVTTTRSLPTPTSLTSPKVAAAYLGRVVPTEASALAKLEKLKPPSSEAADWRAFIALQKRQVALLRRVQRKAHAHNVSLATDLAKLPALQHKVAAAAFKVGAETCAI